jgi:hypothetical protein
MTQTNRRTSHTSSADGRRTRRPAHSSEREARARRSFDGVVASYIRELSAADAAPRAGRGLHAA